MTLLVFDGRTGASGDMLLGALIAAGANPDALTPIEDALDVSYDISTVDKRGIQATQVVVEHTGDNFQNGDPPLESNDHGHAHDHDHDHTHSHSDDHSHSHDHDHTHSHSDDHSHSHDHDHSHSHDHDHSHSHDHDHSHTETAEGHGPNRTFREVLTVLHELDLPGSVADDAESVFRILGDAEASVHGTDLEETHFHEVGADDAIADIVGVSLLIDDLDPDRVITTPVALGGGEVTMSHGRYPVPPPAVTEILALADFQTHGGPEDTELLTPTGAALLAHFAEGTDRIPPMSVEHTGYGAGQKAFAERANVLRAIVGPSTDTGALTKDDVVLLETNVDDVAPEVLGSLHETLQDVGARDVSIVPLTMKKSRPGHLVKVVTKDEDADRVARKLAEETGTLGIRETGVSHRWIANREFEEVLVEYDGHSYEVIVKLASDTDGTVYDVSAEYDDALDVAHAAGVPVREVMRQAEAAVDRD